MQSKEKHKQNKTTAVHTFTHTYTRTPTQTHTRTPTHTHFNELVWHLSLSCYKLLKCAKILNQLPGSHAPRSPSSLSPSASSTLTWPRWLFFDHIAKRAKSRAPEAERADKLASISSTNHSSVCPVSVLCVCACACVWEEAKVFQRQIKLLSELFSLLPLRPTPFASGLSVCQSGRQQGVVNIEICKYA